MRARAGGRVGARGGRKHPQTRSGARRWSSQCCSCATTHAPPAGRRWSRHGAARRARHSCAAAWRRPATCTSQGEEAEAHRRASWVLCCCVGLSRWHFHIFRARPSDPGCARALSNVQLSSPPARAGQRGHIFYGSARASGQARARARARTHAHVHAHTHAHACSHMFARFCFHVSRFALLVLMDTCYLLTVVDLLLVVCRFIRAGRRRC